jgi:hypothetical protein
MQVRTSEPTFSAANSKGHGVNLRDPPPPSRSFAARQSQGDPVASEEPSSSVRESSRTPSPPVRIENRSRTGASHSESMRPEAAGSDGSEGQAGGGGQQGGNNMPREIRPVTAGRDMPIDTEPPRTSPMQLASLSRSGGPHEGGGSRDVAESSRRALPPDEPPGPRCCCCLGPSSSEGSGRGLGSMAMNMEIIELAEDDSRACFCCCCCCYCCI